MVKHCQIIAGLRGLGTVVIQLYAGECTSSVNRAYAVETWLYISVTTSMSLDCVITSRHNSQKN